MHLIFNRVDFKRGILSVFWIPVLLILLSQLCYAESVVFIATGTGQTTGHIATLYVENNTQQPFSFETEGFFIPSEGNYQSYVVPYPLNFSIDASEKMQIPIIGYCADVNTPPVPDGKELPAFSNWIFHSDEWFDDWTIDLDVFYKYHGLKPDELNLLNSSNPIVFNSLYFFSLKKSNQNVDARSKGTAVTNHISSDNSDFFKDYALVIPSKEPFSFGLLALDAAFSLLKTVKEMQAGRQLITPYTDFEKREKEALMQHSIWIYTAALEGKIYSKEDFKLKLKEELQQQTGLLYENMPEEMKNSLQIGTDQFWEGFRKLGKKAGVFSATPF